MRVLISGASFAGLSTAFWLKGLGYQVTVVEIASGLRTGGTAVDIKGNTVGIVKRMGIFEAIKANRLSLERTELKNQDGLTVHTSVLRKPGEPPSDGEFEIERNVLLNILFEAVGDGVEWVFDDRITALRETSGGVDVTFKKSAPRGFDLVLGCDGLHSGVRKIWFGNEAGHTHFLELYASVTIVDKLLIERNTLQMFNLPGKAVMLNAYKNKTDIILAFASEKEIPFDHRDEAQQRRIIAEQFAGQGWRTAELLREVQGSQSFYFDKLSQIRMPSWSKGRVALVGDAGYCASPAAGMGGSLAIEGAAAFADAMREHPGDLERAFHEYEMKLRPFVEEVQAEAAANAREMFVPRTAEAILARNAQAGAAF